MSAIYVGSSQALEEVINNLDSLNKSFREQADAIDAEHQNLVSKWQGDASTAFEDHYSKEKGNFENFAQAIDEYIAGLRTILENYEAAETMNKNIATN